MKCPSCGCQNSEKSDKCFGCQADLPEARPISAKSAPLRRFAGVVILVVVVLGAWAVYEFTSSLSVEDAYDGLFASEKDMADFVQLFVYTVPKDSELCAAGVDYIGKSKYVAGPPEVTVVGDELGPPEGYVYFENWAHKRGEGKYAWGLLSDVKENIWGEGSKVDTQNWPVYTRP